MPSGPERSARVIVAFWHLVRRLERLIERLEGHDTKE